LIQTADWSFLDDETLTLDEKCENFHAILESATAATIPTSFVKCNKKTKKPWITPYIIQMINKRWAAFRSCDFPRYNHYKTKVRLEIAKSKANWIKKMQGSDLWKTVNTHLGSKSKDPLMSLLSEYGSLSNAVETVNSALASVFLPKKQDQRSLKYEKMTNGEEWKARITPELVEMYIKKVPKHKSSPDLPVMLYKAASAFLADPLCKLYRLSIAQKTVPKLWKVAAIAPIPKTSSPTLNDLRPISLLPFPGKILERIVLNSLKNRFLKNYGDNQYGFRPKSSTQCALISLNEKLTSFLDDKSTCGAIVVAYDYSKAFDKLRHDLIIDRLVACDFPQDCIIWIKNYLSDRQQFTKIGITRSDNIQVSSGVPQGSILGPYLYALTTGSYTQVCSDCHLVKFADDTTLCFPLYRNSKNSHVLLEHDNLLRWSDSMGLSINAMKCKSLLIPKGKTCESVHVPGVHACNKLKVLGVWFNEKGTWSTHASEITKIASRRLFALRTISPHLSPERLRVVYFSLVRSILEYCAPLFVKMSANDSARLERVQRRFHRIMHGNDCRKNCLPSLQERRVALSLKLLAKILTDDHILHKHLPTRSNSGRFILPYRATSRRSNSFFLYVCELYNINHPR
jgi:hypothetical protein